jgi:hypothetical protein
VECITKNQTPFNDGLAGLRVVKMLEAADQSLRGRGAAVRIRPTGTQSSVAVAF